MSKKDEHDASDEMEARLLKWEPPLELARAPTNFHVDPEVAIAGRWAREGGGGTAVIEIHSAGDAVFDVHMHVDRGATFWEFERIATFADGVVDLDRPVAANDIYQQLFAVSYDGRELLIPGCYVDLLDAGLLAEEIPLDELTFQRAD